MILLLFEMLASAQPKSLTISIATTTTTTINDMKEQDQGNYEIIKFRVLCSMSFF